MQVKLACSCAFGALFVFVSASSANIKQPVPEVLLRPSLDPTVATPVELRTTCCLWYKVPEAEKCHTCPLIRAGEIAERWKATAVR